ncbi:unnamed protein product [Penicillium nalgiovense]|nr:unnamed protein product [Penicillium nalgiovense]
MPPKRERTVQGSCWPCKQRRVKCDLGKPLCQRCISSGAKCCYDKVLIRWKETPTTRSLTMCQSPIMSLNIHLKDNTLTVGDLKALEYFQFAVWPLFTTAAHPCPPPIPLAMECQPVLLAVCELAEAHRTLRDEAGSSTVSAPFDKRMSCLASVREQLRDDSNHTSLSPLLVAVFLLYFLDGLVECDHQSASTASHHVGVQAIVDHLGGFSALIKIGQKDVTMLLSEFASADLTKALLDDRPPCFPAEIWTQIEHGTVWWDQETYNGTTLASVFRIMSEMSLYRQQIRGDTETLPMEVVRGFERCLQPSYQILDFDHLKNPSTYTVHESTLERRMQADSFTRAFQHSALVYLYRAICGLPPRHSLVQQHVQSCVECIKNISPLSKAHNCIIFPLYIMGAHTFLQDQQAFVLERLDSIYKYLRFNCVLLVRAALEDLWKSPRHDGDWWGMFRSLGRHVLVI